MIDSSLIFDGTINSTAPGGVTGVAITSTADSTNTLDLLVGRDMGAGDLLGIHIDITQAFTTTNSATLQIQFEVSADNSTFYQVDLSPVYPAAQLIAGAPLFRQGWPLNQLLNAAAGILKAPGRYYKLNYIVGTGVFSAGKVFSYVNPAMDRQQVYNYANNYTAYVATGEV